MRPGFSVYGNGDPGLKNAVRYFGGPQEIRNFVPVGSRRERTEKNAVFPDLQLLCDAVWRGGIHKCSGDGDMPQDHGIGWSGKNGIADSCHRRADRTGDDFDLYAVLHRDISDRKTDSSMRSKKLTKCTGFTSLI